MNAPSNTSACQCGASILVDVAALFLSTASANIPLPFGVFGLDPSRMLAVPPFAIPRPAGLASFSFAMPNLPALAGTPIYSQAAVLRSPALLGLTNVNVDVIEWSRSAG